MPSPIEATSSTLDVAHEESIYNKYVQASIFINTTNYFNIQNHYNFLNP